jgi:hypothetical protein
MSLGVWVTVLLVVLNRWIRPTVATVVPQTADSLNLDSSFSDLVDSR